MYGPADLLEFRDIPKPSPAEDEVLIEVRATGLNAADRLLMHGEPFAVRVMAGGPRRPRADHVLGRAVAGRVAEAGVRVTTLRPGDEVYAECTGALAEYVSAPAQLVAPKPASLGFAQAATLPVAATAALQALRDCGQVREDQRVLVNGASGGVGTFAVQIAAAYGARVTAVCATRNLGLVRSLGAVEAVDCTREDFTAATGRYDVILDLVGDHPLGALRRALVPSGTLVLSAGTGGRWLGPTRRLAAALMVSPFVQQRLRPFAASRTRDDLIVLDRMVATGDLHAVIGRIYPFAEAITALHHLDHGHPVGNLVVTT
ncbi:NAD(P)-dependent alcohol dehydrogenase [Kitasatospora camelliae]|uniref:NAD(P)-dependent alcohol dehydrogenase n=1 Tax=Kitasatospora camelliae TaxID=3156397 RepID=A0AAU8K4U2_9ACTN